MVGSKLLKKIFGDKAAKDRKLLEPVVEQIKQVYGTLQGLSNDELRARSADLRARISAYIATEEDEIKALKEQAALSETSVEVKQELYERIDELEKVSDQKLEEILKEILGNRA